MTSTCVWVGGGADVVGVWTVTKVVYVVVSVDKVAFDKVAVDKVIVGGRWEVVVIGMSDRPHIRL